MRIQSTSGVANLVAPRGAVSREMREARLPHRGMAFWFTGLSGSGKSTLAYSAEEYFFRKDYSITVLDGDILLGGLCSDLGFSPEDRLENNRRIAELAKLFVLHGTVCICAFISPYEESRRRAREIIGAESFREIYISCSLEECERRDVKGFYIRARSGGGSKTGPASPPATRNRRPRTLSSARNTAPPSGASSNSHALLNRTALNTVYPPPPMNSP